MLKSNYKNIIKNNELQHDRVMKNEELVLILKVCYAYKTKEDYIMKVKKALTILICTVIGVSLIFNTNSGSYALGKEPIEIISKRSEYEKHFDNGDGTITAFVNTAPLHYSDNGEWKEIDNTLIPDNSGNYVNKNNSMKVTLSSETSVKSINTNNSNQMVCINKNGYTISWDIVDLNNKISILNNSSEIKIENDDCVQDVKLGNKKLNAKAGNIVNKLDSSISYDSIYNNIDLNIDIEPSSVKETIVLNSRNSVKEKFTFFIKADNLEAKLMEDGSISFYPLNGETVFKIPPAFMFDSSANTEYNYDIETNIKKCMDGYLLTLIPNSEWINDSNRVYPIMIDPEVVTIKGSTSSYISESEPNQNLQGRTLIIGGSKSEGTRHEAYVYVPDQFLYYDNNIKIENASLNIYFYNNSYSGLNMPVDIYSINTEPHLTTWNTDNGVNEHNTEISNFELEEGSYGWQSANITKLAWAWFNYAKPSQNQGLPNYGLKLMTRNSDRIDSRIFKVCSTQNTHYSPYIEVTYTTYTNYSMGYSPYKYNDFQNVNNFQKRMNCYAYALQMYYRGDFPSGTSIYKLHPGEFGLTLSDSLYEDNIDTWDILYRGYETKNSASEMYLYVKQQMQRDATALGISMNEIKMEKNFILPSSYNENYQRIIALVASKNDFHFFVRNGNGTCGKNEHAETCSIWSHKPGTSVISKSVSTSTSYGESLCDSNILRLATEYYGNSTPVFFITNQNINLYDSYFYNGQYSGSTGTQFVQ